MVNNFQYALGDGCRLILKSYGNFPYLEGLWNFSLYRLVELRSSDPSDTSDPSDPSDPSDLPHLLPNLRGFPLLHLFFPLSLFPKRENIK